MSAVSGVLLDQIEEMIEDGLISSTSNAGEVYDAYTTAYHHELSDEGFCGDDADDLHDRIESAIAHMRGA